MGRRDTVSQNREKCFPCQFLWQQFLKNQDNSQPFLSY
ncbi:unnamed protein product [Paramecium sonneborni]|uniref:Uncharacterized protein n=1 Tax=Paramecium sonneborni TaxID=65129 RepID=A0A8S1M7Q5_9CILI|nr:unnamed protein product [Paramecium sonneborni]